MTTRLSNPPAFLERLAEIVLSIQVFALPLCLGGAPDWVIWPWVASSAGGLFLIALQSLAQKRPVAVPFFAVVFLCVITACGLQLVPVPLDLLRRLSPAAAELVEVTLAPLGLSLRRPITVDPTATWRELAKHISYLSCFLVAAQLSHDKSSRVRLIRIVAISGLLVSLIGYGHTLLNARALFGLYHYQYAVPPFLTTFGNPNHLAAFLLLSSTCCVVLGIKSTKVFLKVFWLSAYVLSAVALFLSLSRGGIIAFLASQMLFVVLLIRQKHPLARQQPERRTLLAVIGALSLVSVIAGFVALDAIVSEFDGILSTQQLIVSKIALWPTVIHASRNYGILGMGRGAFEFGFSRFQESFPGVLFTHPENWFVQLWAEFGPYVTFVLIVLGSVSLLRVRKTLAASTVNIASTVCLFGLLLHDSVDFSLELPALGTCATVLAALLLGGDKIPWSLPVAPSKAVISAIVLGTGALAAAFAGRSTARANHESLLVSASSNDPHFREIAINAVDRHPADAFIYSTAATFYVAGRRPEPREALAWVNSALFLRPGDAQAHLVAARALLLLQRRNQAFLEYRLASRADAVALAEALKRRPSKEELFILGSDASARDVYRIGSLLYSQSRARDALMLIENREEGLKQQADFPELLVLKARLQREIGDLDGAQLSVFNASGPPRLKGTIAALKAQILWDKNDREAALSLLENAVQRDPSDWDLTTTLARLELERGRTFRTRMLVDGLRPYVREISLRAGLSYLTGRSYLKDGNFGEALRHFKNAIAEDGSAANVYFGLAETLDQLHRYPDAENALRRALELDPSSNTPSTREWLARLRGKPH